MIGPKNYRSKFICAAPVICKKFKTSRQNYQLKEEFHFKNAQEVLHGFLRTAKDKWNVQKALTLCWQICSLCRSHHPDRFLDVWGKWKGSKLFPQTMQNASKDASTLRRFYKYPRRRSWLKKRHKSRGKFNYSRLRSFLVHAMPGY